MAVGYEMSQSSSRAEIRALQDKDARDLREAQEQKIQAQIAAAVAKSEAEANEAKVTARVALDTVKSLCAGIKANGIKNVDCH